MAKQGKKTERALDAALQRAMDGHHIAVLDIPAVYRHARGVLAAGYSVDEAAQDAVGRYAVGVTR